MTAKCSQCGKEPLALGLCCGKQWCFECGLKHVEEQHAPKTPVKLSKEDMRRMERAMFGEI